MLPRVFILSSLLLAVSASGFEALAQSAKTNTKASTKPVTKTSTKTSIFSADEAKQFSNSFASPIPSKPLSGSVSLEQFRINRQAPQVGQPLGSQTGLNGMQPSLDSFQQNPTLPTMSGQVSSQSGLVDLSKDFAIKKAPYIWGLSRDGGYYDATGQIKTVIKGEDIYKYGGTFIDGTAVPSAPVITNFAKHAYRNPYYYLKKQ